MTVIHHVSFVLVVILLVTGFSVLLIGVTTARPAVERFGIVVASLGTVVGILSFASGAVLMGANEQAGSNVLGSHACLGEASVLFGGLAVAVHLVRKRLPNGDVARVVLFAVATALVLSTAYLGIVAGHDSEPDRGDASHVHRAISLGQRR